MSYLQWYMIWYDPSPDDHVAYMTLERIAECGGTSRDLFAASNGHDSMKYVNGGIAALTKWCRLNCSNVPSPVNVKGKTGFAFNNITDALLFKLTWG